MSGFDVRRFEDLARQARARRDAIRTEGGLDALTNLIGRLQWQQRAVEELRDGLATGSPSLTAIFAEMAGMNTRALAVDLALAAHAPVFDVVRDKVPQDDSEVGYLAALFTALAAHHGAELGYLVDQRDQRFSETGDEDLLRGHASDDRVRASGRDVAGVVDAASDGSLRGDGRESAPSGVESILGHEDVSSSVAGPEVASSGDPAGTVAETTDTNSSGVGDGVGRVEPPGPSSPSPERPRREGGVS